MNEINEIILASGSPRRKEILRSLGLNFKIITPDINEAHHENEQPEIYCVRMAKTKALNISSAHKNSLVIAADTIVVIDDMILGKPKDSHDAFNMLKNLQGREHQVLTGIALAKNEKLLTDYERTFVKFRTLTDAQIRSYISTHESDDKAGSYAVQGKGALLIQNITGDYYNVVGFPVCKFGFMLENFGYTLEDLITR